MREDKTDIIWDVIMIVDVCHWTASQLAGALTAQSMRNGAYLRNIIHHIGSTQTSEIMLCCLYGESNPGQTAHRPLQLVSAKN